MRCLFVSHRNDLHTAVVGKLLTDNHGVKVDHLAADASAGQARRTFHATPGLACGAQAQIDIEGYDLVWARRLRMPQRGTDGLDVEGRAFIDAEWRAAFEGMCLDPATPVVVNPMSAERQAESKLWQLTAAREIGWRLPETLVSNDPDDIRRAVVDLRGRAVVKKLRGTHHRTPLTLDVDAAMLSDTAGLSAAPMILQERIKAACHYRVHVLLDRVTAFRIPAGALDWRPGAGRGAHKVELDPATARLCRRFREVAALHYCILDLIEDDAGRVFFLECNPQGQFLFLEQQTGHPLAAAFARMLLSLLGVDADDAALAPLPV